MFLIYLKKIIFFNFLEKLCSKYWHLNVNTGYINTFIFNDQNKKLLFLSIQVSKGYQTWFYDSF